MPPEVDIKALRQRLRMTQTVFAEKFGLNLQTLRDWEQGRYQPTGPARMLLMVIAKEPDAVLEAIDRARSEPLQRRGRRARSGASGVSSSIFKFKSKVQDVLAAARRLNDQKPIFAPSGDHLDHSIVALQERQHCCSLKAVL